MYHVCINNINNNKVNEIIHNELKFDSRNSLANNTLQDDLQIVTIIIRGGKKSIYTIH